MTNNGQMTKWQKKTSNKFGYYCRWCLVGCALASLLVWLIGLLTLLHANRNSNSASCFCVNTNRVNKIRLLFWLKKNFLFSCALFHSRFLLWTSLKNSSFYFWIVTSFCGDKWQSWSFNFSFRVKISIILYIWWSFFLFHLIFNSLQLFDFGLSSIWTALSNVYSLRLHEFGCVHTCVKLLSQLNCNASYKNWPNFTWVNPITNANLSIKRDRNESHKRKLCAVNSSFASS